jgi:DNA replication and repair protein RecF
LVCRARHLRCERVELTHLRVENFRLIERAELDLANGWNLFLGANGAGKTSLLEAAFLLSHGRSFRTSAKDALVRHGSPAYSVFGEMRRASAINERVGVARNANRLEARLNGEVVAAAELMRHTAVLCFEPGSHELISGSSEERRRFLDWGVFHVEHDFLAHWRRYQRALKQRNALLRSFTGHGELDVWDMELALAAEPLSAMRRDYIAQLRPLVLELLADLLPELGHAELRFGAGFDEERPLLAVLAERRSRDIARGHTTAGPHRADWSLAFGDVGREHLSRGQEKLCAFAAVIAQGRLFAQHAGEWPILCLDDLSSEVDRKHLEKALAVLPREGVQVLATATEAPEAFAGLSASLSRFHVEQGQFSRLL